MKILILLFSIIIFFSSCASKPLRVKQEPLKPLPAWVKSSKNDTDIFLYGVGSGSSYEDSVTSALNLAIAKLNVSISRSFVSELESQRFSETEFIQSSMKSVIKMTVKNTKINNFKVLNTVQRNNEFFSMVEINKIKLKKSLELSISKSIKELTGDFNLLKENPFNLRSNKESLYFRLSKIKYNNSLLTSLNSFENKNFTSSINKLKAKIDASNIRFKIISKKNVFSNILEESLLEHGFESGNDIKVSLSYSIERLNTLDKFKFKLVFKKDSRVILLRVFDIKVRKGSNQISLVKQYFKDDLDLLLEIK